MGTLDGTDYGAKQKNTLDKGWTAAAWNASNLFRSANRSQMLALKQIPGGFGKAQAALTQQGNLAAQDINDQAGQQDAANTQGFISNGLYNTTALDASRRGLRGVRQRSLTELDQHIAEQRAALETAKGAATAAQYGQIAATKQDFIGTLASIASKRSSQYASILFGKQGGLVGPLAQLAGTAAGIYYGQPGNGASATPPGASPPETYHQGYE